MCVLCLFLSSLSTLYSLSLSFFLSLYSLSLSLLSTLSLSPHLSAPLLLDHTHISLKLTVVTNALMRRTRQLARTHVTSIGSIPLLRRASAGAILRGGFALALEYTDLATRVAAIFSFRSAGMYNSASIQIGILVFNRMMQSAFVELSHQPRTEHFHVWVGSKKAVQTIRAVTKVAVPEGIPYSQEAMNTFTRLLDLATESIPSGTFQSFVLATSPTWSVFSVATLASSLASTAYTAVDSHIKMEEDRDSRTGDCYHHCLV